MLDKWNGWLNDMIFHTYSHMFVELYSPFLFSMLAIPCHTPTVATPINHDFQIYNVTMFYAYDNRSPIHSTCSTPSSNLHDIPISNDTLTGKNQDIPIENIVNMDNYA